MEATVNVTTKESPDFLYCSVMGYVQLLNVELPYCPTGRTSIRGKVCLLHGVLGSIVSHHVNLEFVGDRLQLCIYHLHKWPDYTLFLVPIDLMEKLRGEIKRITLESIRRSVKYHRMMGITDTPYSEMLEVCIGHVNFERSGEEEKEDLYRKERLLGSYEKGKIRRKLRRMHSRAFYRNLEKYIRNCDPPSNKGKRLLELVIEGMSLIAKDSPHILNYDYDYASEKERDSEPPPPGY